MNWRAKTVLVPVCPGWSMGRLGSYLPPHRITIRLDARGRRKQAPATATVRVSGDDGYVLTAAPVVACICGMLNGNTRTPGLHPQAHLVDPQHLLADLSAFGLEVEARVEPS